jgi:ABC-type molybdate transport system permease subunit
MQLHENAAANALAVGGIAVTVLTSLVIPRSAASILGGTILTFLLFLYPFGRDHGSRESAAELSEQL